MNKITPQFLKARQSMPLELKIRMSQNKIKQFYDHFLGEVYVSFSGGKDSTVLLDIVRSIYPNVPAVFVDTGLEYPEIKEFVKTIDNVTWLRPKMNFKQVLEKYGYPVLSKDNSQKIHEYRQTKSAYMKRRTLQGSDKGSGKLPNKWHYLLEAPFKISHYCCFVMKKNPAKKYEKESGRKAVLGTMAGESRIRKNTYLKSVCNAFDMKRPKSTPMAFWLEEDVWKYIKENKLPYSPIYDMGVERTGCMFCMFGVHLDKGLNKFQAMKTSHPKLYDYCINKLGCGKVMDYIGVSYV